MNELPIVNHPLDQPNQPADQIPAPEQPKQNRASQRLRTPTKLTRKQKVFVQYIVDNPKEPLKNAAKAAYNVRTERSSEVMASENMTKPEILAELSKYSNDAELALVEVLKTAVEFSKLGNTAGASYGATAITAANSVLDRLHGKATQRVEMTKKSVTLNIDLTSET